jgi:hypothetical protein
MNTLLQILRGSRRPEHGPSTPEYVPRVDHSEWPGAFDLAKRHHVLPWVAARVLDGHSPYVFQEAELQPLREAHRRATIAGFLWTSELKGLLAGFAAASIPVLALKGPWFAQRVYGNVALRSSRDIDLLVRARHLEQAERLLQTLGFTASACADDYHRSWERGAMIVELHFNVENPLAFNFDIAGAWTRAHPGTFEGQPGWTLAPADELRYLCLHGARHRFDRLSRILDIALMLRRPNSLPCSSELHLRPPELEHLWPVIDLGCALAARLQPDCISSLWSANEASPHTLALAAQLWEELLDGPGARMDWAAQHRFYVQMEPLRSQRLFRRLRHLRILASRITEDDVRFAGRFAISRRWMVWAMRPLRLVLRDRLRTPRTPEPDTPKVPRPQQRIA